MKDIEAPKLAVPPVPQNPEFWRRVRATLTTGRAVEVSTLAEAGFSSIQSLRVQVRKCAHKLGGRGHVAKTAVGYAVWVTKDRATP